MSPTYCLTPGEYTGGRGAIAPPNNEVANFDHPRSHAAQLLVANVVCIAVAALFVLTRLYTRQHLTRKFDYDDLTSVIAMVMSILLSITTMIATRYGWGIHCWDLERAHVSAYFKMEIALSTVYTVAIFFVKASILFLYIRIFASSRLVLYSAWVIFGILSIFSLCAFFLSIFACRPVADYWRPDIQGNCISTATLGQISAGVSILTDILIFILPIRSIWKLHLPARQRIQVIAVLGTGLLACVVSVVRIVCFAQVSIYYDATWHVFPHLLWTVVEVNIGIICGCMPTLKPLIRRHFPALGSSSSAPSSDFVETPLSSFTKFKRRYLQSAGPDQIRLPDDDGIELGLNTHRQTESGHIRQGNVHQGSLHNLDIQHIHNPSIQYPYGPSFQHLHNPHSQYTYDPNIQHIHNPHLV